MKVNKLEVLNSSCELAFVSVMLFSFFEESITPTESNFCWSDMRKNVAAPMHTCGCFLFLIRMGRRDLHNTSDRSCVMVKIMVISDQTSVL